MVRRIHLPHHHPQEIPRRESREIPRSKANSIARLGLHVLTYLHFRYLKARPLPATGFSYRHSSPPLHTTLSFHLPPFHPSLIPFPHNSPTLAFLPISPATPKPATSILLHFNFDSASIFIAENTPKNPAKNVSPITITPSIPVSQYKRILFHRNISHNQQKSIYSIL